MIWLFAVTSALMLLLLASIAGSLFRIGQSLERLKHLEGMVQSLEASRVQQLSYYYGMKQRYERTN